MGKNNGGKKQKSMKNSTQQITVKLDDITPNDTITFAALITKALGCKRFVVILLFNNTEVNASLPGSFRKRINVGDYVFVQVATELSGSNCFILHAYTSDELSALNIKKPVQNVDGTIDVGGQQDDIFSFEDI